MKNLLIVLSILLVFSWDAMTKQRSFLPDSFSSTYVKSYKRKVGKRIIKANGILDYKYPSKISMKYQDSGVEVQFVVNHRKVWHFTPAFSKGEKNELKVFKSQKLALLKFLDLLHSGLKDNKMFKVKALKTRIDLVFSKDMTKKYSFVKAELFPKKSIKNVKDIRDLSRLVIHYTKKNAETYTFDKITDKKFSKNHFTFKTPKNTNVTNN
jgi:hypothetical protein